MGHSASEKQISEACERNKGPILSVLKSIIPEKASIIEVACGSGQHADFFTKQMPGWQWQPSDQDEQSLLSACAYREEAGRGNFLEPIQISTLDDSLEMEKFEYAYCCNMIHIAPWSSCVGLFRLLEKQLTKTGSLILYGPFFEDGVDPSESNLNFDASLKKQDSRWGIRHLKEVKFVAEKCGFTLTQRHQMPSNNLMLVFKKGASIQDSQNQ